MSQHVSFQEQCLEALEKYSRDQERVVKVCWLSQYFSQFVNSIVCHVIQFCFVCFFFTIKCSKICSETTRLQLVVPLEF